MMPHPLPDRSTSNAGAPSTPEGNPFVLVGTIVVVKVATIAVVLAAARSAEAGVLVAATTWYWVVPLVGLAAVPVAFALRLRRVRARRAELLRGEWQVVPDAASLLEPMPTPPGDHRPNRQSFKGRGAVDRRPARS